MQKDSAAECGDSYTTWSFGMRGGPCSGTRTHPRGMNQLLGVHFLWLDSLLPCSALVLQYCREGLVLLQIGLPDLVDSPKEGLTPTEEQMEVWHWEEAGDQEKGRERNWGWI